MGAPMARRLISAGYRPYLWNRTAAKLDAFASDDAVCVTSPAAAARAITLTVLGDLPDVEAVLEGDQGLRAGWRAAEIAEPLLVVMGTVSSLGVRDLGERLAADGVRVVDAPISGGVVGAEEGRLSIMAGGTRRDFDELAPVFGCLGTTVRHVGELGAGQTAKTCNQVVVTATVAAISEAFHLARHAGVDPEALLELLGGGLASSEILLQKGPNWVREEFEPGGLARYHLKDFAAVRQLSEEHGITLPVTQAVAGQFDKLVDLGLGDLDHTGIYRALE